MVRFMYPLINFPHVAPTSGQVRLVDIDGNNITYLRRSGVLEVYLDGQWRTVCPSTDWSSQADDLACQQLGYTIYRRRFYSYDERLDTLICSCLLHTHDHIFCTDYKMLYSLSV